MQLADFLEKCSHEKGAFLRNYPVLFFCVEEAQELPIFFAHQLVTQLKAYDLSIESLDLEAVPFARIISQLETSFLGMSLLFWLRGVERIDKKYRQALLEYVSVYKGPHQIIIFADQAHVPKQSEKQSIAIAPAATPALCALLCAFFNKKITPSMHAFFGKMCQTYHPVSLDQTCMVIAYMQVMGKQEDGAFLFDKILNSQKSLFALSQHFFAKDCPAFFKLWSKFENEYSLPFWTVYWSEQLWRAYYAHYFLARQQFGHAKSIGFRLPFSYMQKDWKKTSLSELKNAHQFVYELDLNIKNNIETQAGIELLYSKFFLNQFC